MDPRQEQFFRQLQRDRVALIAYVRAITGDRNLAEDVFQEVSLVFINKGHELKAEGDFQAWCRSVARNIAYRMRAKSKRLVALDDECATLIERGFEEHFDASLAELQRERFRDCVGKLSLQNQELFKMRYVSELSVRALAGKLSRTEAAVHMALSRVRKAISECVQRREEIA